MKTDILFRRVFKNNGNLAILVHRADIKFNTLPEDVRSGFEEVNPQQDSVDLADPSSRWWLCAGGASNLSNLGYDHFFIVRK